MDTYKVYLHSGVNEFSVRELEKKQPTGRQVLIKITGCAVCTLEQRIYTGLFKRYPYAGGHEVAGIVEAVGEGVKYVSPGDKAAVRLLHACGQCYYCRTGRENICTDSFLAETHEGFTGAGGFAEYMLVDAGSVYKLADDTDMAEAALTEPLACCIHSVNCADIQFGDDVVVIGAGVMGQMHIQLAKLRGARVIATEIDPGRIALAKQLGADVVINPNEENAVQKVHELTDGRGADAALCTLAIAKLGEEAVAMLGKMGKAVYYSAFHPDLPIEINPSKIHSSEQQIIGAINPTPRDFLMATRLISNKAVQLKPLISDVIPITEINRALDEAVSPCTMRIIVKP